MDNINTDITLSEIEATRPTPKDLALVCRKLGYRTTWEQLQFDNGASVTNLLMFFEDNPEAISRVIEFILERACDAEGNTVLREEPKCDEEETEED